MNCDIPVCLELLKYICFKHIVGVNFCYPNKLH